MASATLEMIIDLVGVNKAARGFKKVSSGLKLFNDEAEEGSKKAKKFGSSLSGLQKTAIAGGALIAGKALFDFSKEAVNAATSADEAAAAFGTTFGTAAQRATEFLEDFANKAGLTVGEAQQLTATLGAVAQGIGFTQEESADLSIELTKIAADVASFSNITAGAEPVLQAFRSALVGEREALKTYGAITEAEVQTKAFEQTGKFSADMLTRQEKAFATLALIQEKAAVQIGDLDRTLLSFANQSRIVGAELRELREDIGKELIPALEILLPKFRELVEDIAPSLIEGFGNAATTVIDLVLALDRFNDMDEGLLFLIKNFRELAEEQRAINEAFAFANRLTTEKIVAEALLNTEKRKSRNESNLQRVAFEKLDTQLQKKSIPLLKSYIDLVGMLTGEDEDLTGAEDELTDAKNRVTEAQRREALATAEERLQKKELQAQIQELLFFQEKGIDVSEELAVAQEKLKLVEFELTRESEELRTAKKDLADIEKELAAVVDETTDSFEKQVEEFVKLNEAADAFNQLNSDEDFMDLLRANKQLNPFIAANLDVLSKIASLQGLDQRARELGRFADAAERLAAAQNAGSSGVPRVSVSSPSPSTAFVPNTATQLADARLSSIANNIDVKVQIGEEEFDAAVETSSQRSQDRSAFFSRLVAAGAE
jgi:hypothetical protein